VLVTVGAIPNRDRARLLDLYRFRLRIRDHSPDIGAADMALHAERALRELPPVITGTRRWLASRDLIHH